VTRGVVATPHYLATEAGAEVLRDGGNAVDAAVAANAVLCVVYPHMTSIGGDLFALVWPAGAAKPVGVEGAGRSGEGASLEAMRERGFERVMPARGALTVTVPGTVQAWGRMVERFGRFGMGRVLEPAAALARDGYPVTAKLSAFLTHYANVLAADPATAPLYPPMKGGMTLRNPDLATVLSVLGRNGFGAFYFGEVGAAIADAIQRRNGFLTQSDMALHRAGFVDGVAFEYRDVTVYGMPPPTQGLVALGMLARLGRVRGAELGPGPEFADRMRSLREVTYLLRDKYISDPLFSSVPAEPFLDPDCVIEGAVRQLPEGDTIHLCTADEEGNLVSLTQSLAYSFGSGVVADGTGILLQNRGCYFSLDPADVNRLEPRKRTMHTLIPALGARGGQPWAAFGTMGGEGQPQILTQVAVNLIDHGLGPAEAVAAPRVRVAPDGVRLWVEADYPGAAQLRRGGGDVELLPPLDSRLGHAQAVLVDGPHAWRGGADPRSDGSVEIV